MNKVFLILASLALGLNPQLTLAQTEDISQSQQEEVINACLSSAIVSAGAD